MRRLRSAWFVSVLVGLLAVASYGTNFLRAAAPEVRDVLVPDSLVYGGLSAHRPVLGDLTEKGFEPYTSQYGGQFAVYRVLTSTIGVPTEWLGPLNAFALACVVAGLTYFAARHMFGVPGGLALGVFLSLDPWMIMFSKSVYWVWWLALLPLVLATALGPWAMHRRARVAVLLALLAATFFVRFLCGYEYASAIAMFAAAPLAFYSRRRGASLVAILGMVFSVGAASAAGFLGAVVLHAASLGPSVASGMRTIQLVAAKHVPSTVPIDSAIASVCPFSKSPAGCMRAAQQAVSAPRLEVVAIYLTFRRNMPWLAGRDLFDNPQLGPLRQALRHRMLREVAREIGRVGFLASTNLAFTMLLSWVLIAGAGWVIWRRRSEEMPAAILLGMLAAASLSWHLLAKVHSYLHLYYNFVLWAPLLAFSAAVLATGATNAIVATKPTRTS